MYGVFSSHICVTDSRCVPATMYFRKQNVTHIVQIPIFRFQKLILNLASTLPVPSHDILHLYVSGRGISTRIQEPKHQATKFNPATEVLTSLGD